MKARETENQITSNVAFPPCMQRKQICVEVSGTFTHPTAVLIALFVLSCLCLCVCVCVCVCVQVLGIEKVSVNSLLPSSSFHPLGGAYFL